MRIPAQSAVLLKRLRAALDSLVLARKVRAHNSLSRLIGAVSCAATLDGSAGLQ